MSLKWRYFATCFLQYPIKFFIPVCCLGFWCCYCCWLFLCKGVELLLGQWRHCFNVMKPGPKWHTAYFIFANLPIKFTFKIVVAFLFQFFVQHHFFVEQYASTPKFHQICLFYLFLVLFLQVLCRYFFSNLNCVGSGPPSFLLVRVCQSLSKVQLNFTEIFSFSEIFR